jgi:hypothetical protein
VFACFSAAALLSPRRQYVYLGGLLSSVLTTFMWMRLGTWVFGGGAALFQAELYVGLAVFSGYVVSRSLGWAGGREGGGGISAAAAAQLCLCGWSLLAAGAMEAPSHACTYVYALAANL